jgi:diguanylate cyclase (GGDEF)-like protein/PAS domain S-box-containing protein
VTDHRVDDATPQPAVFIQGSHDALVATDVAGVITAWSLGAEELYGYPSAEVIGAKVCPSEELWARVISGTENIVMEETRQRPDGTFIEIELRASATVDDEGTVTGALVVVRDIGERLRRDQELNSSREVLERIQAIGHVGSWDTRIGPEELMMWSPETYRIFGIEEGTTVRNLDLFGLIHADDRQLLLETLIQVRKDHHSTELELRITRSDGEERWILLTADGEFDDEGVATGHFGLIRDITERKEAELRLAHDALHDRLTGLPSRVLFLDRVTRAVARAARDRSRVAVLYLDLDGFALFNATQGHEFGDQLLRAVADRLVSATPITDTVARLGADEFGLVCEDILSATDAAARAARMLSVVERPFASASGEVLITASIGVALSSAGVSPEALVRDADLAMHRAKEQGRNRFELYDLGLRQQAEQRLAMETDLHRAVGNAELFLAFQPILSLTENRFVGVEALVRWHHPERGVIQPNEFIPVAEETGLIVPIGTWVLESACRQLKEWRAAAPGEGPWSMSVNVAAAQLSGPAFVDVVQRAMRDNGLGAGALRMELTESVFVEGGGATDVLRRIQQLGVGISVDDFGTKYSALSYLTRLPIDELKIDQSFVEGLVSDASNQAIVSAVLAIGGSLGLDVVAEGVETEAQLAELRRLGCQQVQGFHIARPLGADECFSVLVSGTPR